MSDNANPTKPISRIGVEPKAIAGIQMTSDIHAAVIKICDLGLSFGVKAIAFLLVGAPLGGQNSAGWLAAKALRIFCENSKVWLFRPEPCYC